MRLSSRLGGSPSIRKYETVELRSVFHLAHRIRNTEDAALLMNRALVRILAEHSCARLIERSPLLSLQRSARGLGRIHLRAGKRLGKCPCLHSSISQDGRSSERFVPGSTAKFLELRAI